VTPPLHRSLSPAEPLALGEAVQYQAGAIVSRTLLKGETGTLTQFAFDEGQGLSEDTAPFDALVQSAGASIRLDWGLLLV